MRFDSVASVSVLLNKIAGHYKQTEKPELLLYQNCIHFTDRKKYDLELHQFFDANFHGQRRFVLWGFGGSG